MTFMMILKRKRSENEKEAILKEIYYDNLKLAGKHIEGDRSGAGWLARVKPLQVLAFMLILVLFSLSELNTSPHVSARQPFPALLSVSDKMIETTSTMSKSRTGYHWDGLWDKIPGSNYMGPGEAGFDNYKLLLSESDDVRLSSLFGLGVKTIVIDPGHGGRDPGAIGAMGTMEKDITLDVALKLKSRLAELGRHHVLLTRENDRTMALADRVKFARRNNADLFISIHVNSLPNKNKNIIETFYFGPPLNYEALLLAEKENKESHFSVENFDSIIQDLGNTLKRQESKKLATAIQSNLFNNRRVQDAQVQNYGIKTAPFVVLSQTEVPSVLVEISCITNVKEEKKLTSSRYRSMVAAYMEAGVVTYLEIHDSKLLIGEK